MFGYPDHVVAAGLLHDILNFDTTAVELRVRFGPVIAGLVEAVSENPALRIRSSARPGCAPGRGRGPGAAAVFAAASSEVREIRIRAAWDEGFAGTRRRAGLDHDTASRSMLEQELGDHPVVKALASSSGASTAAAVRRAFTGL